MDIAAIGRQFGLDETQTRTALDALAPVCREQRAPSAVEFFTRI